VGGWAGCAASGDWVNDTEVDVCSVSTAHAVWAEVVRRWASRLDHEEADVWCAAPRVPNVWCGGVAPACVFVCQCAV